MKNFYRSQGNFKQYKPYVSKWRRLINYFKKRKTNVAPVAWPSEKLLSNPFKKPRQKKWWLGRLVIYVLILALILWLWLLVSSSYFKITRVTFEGLNIIKQEEINTLVWDNYFNKGWLFGLMPNDNYFLASADNLKKIITEKYALNSINIKKEFPGGVNVSLEEKISSVIYDNGQNYFLLDEDGNTIRKIGQVGREEFALNKEAVIASSSGSVSGASLASATTTTSTLTHVPNFPKYGNEYRGYPLIYDKRNKQITETQTEVLPKKTIDFLLATADILRQEGIAEVKYFELDGSEAGISIICAKPKKIILNQEKDLSAQMNNIKIVLRNYKPKEYIDVRFGERVFWR